MDNIGTELIIILVLTLANGFFAAAEISIVSAKRGRLEARAEAGNKGAKTALEMTENPDQFLAAVQVGISLIGTFSAAFGGARIADVLAVTLVTAFPALEGAAEGLALFVVVLGITYLSLVLGELAPKRLALQRAEAMAEFAAPVMKRIAIITRPIIAVLTVSVQAVVRLMGGHSDSKNLVTIDDIVYIARAGEVSGSVESGGAQMIERVLNISEQPIRAIMTPRPDIQSIPIGLSLPEVISAIRETGLTRLPVFDGDADNIIGVLNAKDLVTSLIDSTQFTVRAVMRQPLFLVENLSVNDALARFRQASTHIALVIGEYGEVAGLVTLEDVLEELVGDIRDEHDGDDPDAFVLLPDGSWEVSGIEQYERVAEQVGLPDEGNENRPYTTLGGMILDRLENIPKVGDTVTEGAFTLEVLSMQARRVHRVRIRRVQADKSA